MTPPDRIGGNVGHRADVPGRPRGEQDTKQLIGVRGPNGQPHESAIRRGLPVLYGRPGLVTTDRPGFGAGIRRGLRPPALRVGPARPRARPARSRRRRPARAVRRARRSSGPATASAPERDAACAPGADCTPRAGHARHTRPARPARPGRPARCRGRARTAACRGGSREGRSRRALGLYADPRSGGGRGLAGVRQIPGRRARPPGPAPAPGGRPSRGTPRPAPRPAGAGRGRRRRPRRRRRPARRPPRPGHRARSGRARSRPRRGRAARGAASNAWATATFWLVPLDSSASGVAAYASAPNRSSHSPAPRAASARPRPWIRPRWVR